MSLLPRAVLFGLLTFVVSMSAHAGVIINIQESGSNVVATASGSLNLAGLTLIGSTAIQNGINASINRLMIGGPTMIVGAAVYTGASSISNFGAGGFFLPSSNNGSPIGFVSNVLYVPTGYVSGSPISAFAQFDNQTLASMGLTPGKYVMTWSADSLTMNIGTEVPEPSSIALVLLGSVMLVSRRFGRR